MIPIKARWMYLLSFAISLLTVGAAPVSQIADSVLIASDGDRDPIFACREDEQENCWEEGESADGVVTSFSHYVEQVLANEWHGQSGSEALKTAAVAIRTFSDRNPGCGARLPYNWNPWPGYLLGILYNGSQAYWIEDGSSWRQNTVTSAHESARSATDGVQLYRADWEVACAKHNADCGDPTLACDQSNCGEATDRDTLQSVPDPVAQHRGTEEEPSIAPGIAQNGTVAWERGSAPWDYRQMLTHYYSEVRLAGSSNYYRWTWLNTGQDHVYLNYHGTANPTPGVIYLEDPRQRQVEIRIQNTSRETWNPGSVKLSYRWYFTSGAFINQGPEFDTRATEPFDPSETQEVIATLDLPDDASPGDYELRWDLKRYTGPTTSIWFSSQNNWPTLDSLVHVQHDTNPPSNPPSASVSSPSGHIRNGWSAQTQLALDWSGASDAETGVDGYSIAWDQNSSAIPDTSKDTSSSEASSTLSDRPFPLFRSLCVRTWPRQA